jgi:cell wall-associated NlpC family hydrolase
MIKTILSTVTILFFLGAYQPVVAQAKQVSLNSSKGDVKFLDDITVEVAPINSSNSEVSSSLSSKKNDAVFSTKKIEISLKNDIESAQRLQFKYALILDTEVEMVKNLNLVSLVDEWMGTRYRLGGTTKAGIDCSAFMQVLFAGIYGIALPRTAREQYNNSQRISRTELKEGDLIFFNTTGGVSHVGMYLQNNKFVHASSSGVTISDIFDEYWVRRFVGVGRVQDTQEAPVLISKL